MSEDMNGRMEIYTQQMERYMRRVGNCMEWMDRHAAKMRTHTMRSTWVSYGSFEDRNIELECKGVLRGHESGMFPCVTPAEVSRCAPVDTLVVLCTTERVLATDTYATYPLLAALGHAIWGRVQLEKSSAINIV